jgi:hypothetical protein
MKKIILFLCVVLAAACTKEEDSIVGTKWGRAEKDGYEIIEFVSKSEMCCYGTTAVGLISRLKFKGEYILNGDSIKFTEEILTLQEGLLKQYARGATISGSILELDTYWTFPGDMSDLEGDPEVNRIYSKIE